MKAIRELLSVNKALKEFGEHLEVGKENKLQEKGLNIHENCRHIFGGTGIQGILQWYTGLMEGI